MKCFLLSLSLFLFGCVGTGTSTQDQLHRELVLLPDDLRSFAILFDASNPDLSDNLRSLADLTEEAHDGYHQWEKGVGDKDSAIERVVVALDVATDILKSHSTDLHEDQRILILVLDRVVARVRVRLEEGVGSDEPLDLPDHEHSAGGH